MATKGNELLVQKVFSPEGIALHEAAHAVIARHYRFTVEEIRVDRDGGCTTMPEHWFRFNASEDVLKAGLDVYLAGWAASEVACGAKLDDPFDYGSGADMEFARHVAGALRLRRLSRNRTAESFIVESRERVADLVRRYWSIITRVASAILTAGGYLYGHEFLAVVGGTI